MNAGENDYFWIVNHFDAANMNNTGDQANTRCLNCGEMFSGDFCPNCGQKASTGRITVKSSFQSFLAAVSSMDSAFFRTMGNLLWRPGNLVREYICGRRVRYVHPVKLLTSLVAVYLLVAFIFGINPGEVNVVDVETMDNLVHSESLESAIHFLSNVLNNKVASSLLLAFICLMPFALMFRSKTVARPDGSQSRLNVAEHFCALVYVACVEFAFSMVLKLAESMGVSHNLISSIDGLQFLIVPILLYRQMLEISWWSSVWRSISALILTLAGLIFWVIFAFGMFYGIDAVS